MNGKNSVIRETVAYSKYTSSRARNERLLKGYCCHAFSILRLGLK